MAACRVCGEIYGVLDLKDGVCKNCLSINGANNHVHTQQVIKKYTGKELKARELFNQDREKMLKDGYHMVSERYIHGQYSTMNFIVALLLCFLVFGIFILFYMLIVKPEGILIVTYEYKEEIKEDSKVCPECAETIKSAAHKCRFCGHLFSDIPL